MTKIEERAEVLGLHVSTWSPGDGWTRYRFSQNAGDYFSVDGLFTALGSKEADIFLFGYATALNVALEKGRN